MSESDRAATTRAPAKVSPANVPGMNGLLGLAVGVVIVAALFLAREVLIPITLAVLLSFVLQPIVGLLRRINVPRVLAVLLAVVFALGIIVALGSLIGLQLADLASNLPRYATSIERKVGAAQGYVTHQISALTSHLGPAQHPADAGPAAGSAGAPAGSDGAAQKPIPVEVQQPGLSPFQLARQILTPVLNPVADAAIVLIVAIFILLQKEDLRDRLIRLFGSNDLHRTTAAMNEAGHRLSRYFLSQLGINAIFGVVIGIGLYLIGIPSPILWGILGTLLRFVPYIGSFIAGALPVALAAGVSPGWTLAIETAGLFVVIETLTGQFVEPLVYGHSTGLSPFSVVVAAIFWTWIWGPIGLILSTPMTLCLVVLGRYVDRLEFLDVLLGDQPALTPVENFYQRMLAGDTDEAQDQAEQFLKDHALSCYYDEVALKGLQLAATDAERGVLGSEQLDRVRQAVQALVSELASHEDSEAVAKSGKGDKANPKHPPTAVLAPEHLDPAWRSETPVLCLAGRGPLDEAASTMLAQILGKHGLKARVVPYNEASRERVQSLDTGGVAMICISYLDLSGTPSHLRYLVRRLRRQAPGAHLLVGLWPAEDAALSDEHTQAALNADFYTSSLRQAVADCLKAAQGKAGPAHASASPQPASAPVLVPATLGPA